MSNPPRVSGPSARTAQPPTDVAAGLAPGPAEANPTIQEILKAATWEGCSTSGEPGTPNDLNRLTCCALLHHEVSDFVKNFFCSILAAQSVTIVPANWARKCFRRTGQSSSGSDHSRSCARGRCLDCHGLQCAEQNGQGRPANPKSGSLHGEAPRIPSQYSCATLGVA